MAEAGILAREDRVELIEGEIVDMAPIGSAHAGKVTASTSLVAPLSPPTARVNRRRAAPPAPRAPRRAATRPRAVAPQSGLLPSSAIPTAADVLLLVEVAESSLAFDRGPKLALYARHGARRRQSLNYGALRSFALSRGRGVSEAGRQAILGNTSVTYYKA